MQQTRVLLPSSKMAAILLGVTHFLSCAHGAWVIDAQGARQIDPVPLLRLSRQQLQQTVSCASSLDTIQRVGSTWNERCRNCTCTSSGKVCDGPVCSKPYEVSQELTCGRWSSDGCCCVEFGCRLGPQSDILVPLGADIPRGTDDPLCRSCACNRDGTRKCVWQMCDPMACADPVTVPGQCCPLCPNNHTCVLPMKLRMLLPREMLQQYEPVRENLPIVVARGSPIEHTCYCEQGTIVATCVQETARTSRLFDMVA